jgi:hypothetical protein
MGKNARGDRENRRKQRDQQQQFGDHRDPHAKNTGSRKTLQGICALLAAYSPRRKWFRGRRSGRENILPDEKAADA